MPAGNCPTCEPYLRQLSTNINKRRMGRHDSRFASFGDLFSHQPAVVQVAQHVLRRGTRDQSSATHSIVERTHLEDADRLGQVRGVVLTRPRKGLDEPERTPAKKARQHSPDSKSQLWTGKTYIEKLQFIHQD